MRGEGDRGQAEGLREGGEDGGWEGDGVAPQLRLRSALMGQPLHCTALPSPPVHRLHLLAAVDGVGHCSSDFVEWLSPSRRHRSLATSPSPARLLHPSIVFSPCLLTSSFRLTSQRCGSGCPPSASTPCTPPPDETPPTPTPAPPPPTPLPPPPPPPPPPPLPPSSPLPDDVRTSLTAAVSSWPLGLSDTCVSPAVASAV